MKTIHSTLMIASTALFACLSTTAGAEDEGVARISDARHNTGVVVRANNSGLLPRRYANDGYAGYGHGQSHPKHVKYSDRVRYFRYYHSGPDYSQGGCNVCDDGSGGLLGYFIPTGCGGAGCPIVGAYEMIYPVDPNYHDARDGRVYAASASGVPMAVPLAPVVNYTYNYGWGVPSSRLTPVSRVQR